MVGWKSPLSSMVHVSLSCNARATGLIYSRVGSERGLLGLFSCVKPSDHVLLASSFLDEFIYILVTNISLNINALHKRLGHPLLTSFIFLVNMNESIFIRRLRRLHLRHAMSKLSELCPASLSTRSSDHWHGSLTFSYRMNTLTSQYAQMSTDFCSKEMV